MNVWVMVVIFWELFWCYVVECFNKVFCVIEIFGVCDFGEVKVGDLYNFVFVDEEIGWFDIVV